MLRSERPWTDRRLSLVCSLGLLGITSFLGASCQSALPEESPPLVDMEEPLNLFAEPADEAQRQQLPLGTFSGLELAGAPSSLDSAFGSNGAAKGLEVERVVENSPAAIARIEVGDLLLEATYPGQAGPTTVELQFPSDWRAIELGQPVGTQVDLLLDRAGRDAHTHLVLTERSAPAARQEAARFREEQRAGIVVRTATEVEARAAGLAPGAGAVLVGLSRNSPWRPAGLRFGDLLTAVNGTPLGHPQILLDALRGAPKDGSIEVIYRRPNAGEPGAAPTFAEPETLKIAVTQRGRAVRELSIPLVFHYERTGPKKTHWSALLGALRYQHTPAAWRFRLLWLIRLGAGDTEALTELTH